MASKIRKIMLNSKKIRVLAPTERLAVFRLFRKKTENIAKKNDKTADGVLRVYPVKTVKSTVKRCGAVRALATFISFFFQRYAPTVQCAYGLVIYLLDMLYKKSNSVKFN